MALERQQVSVSDKHCKKRDGFLIDRLVMSINIRRILNRRNGKKETEGCGSWSSSKMITMVAEGGTGEIASGFPRLEEQNVLGV